MSKKFSENIAKLTMKEFLNINGECQSFGELAFSRNRANIQKKLNKREKIQKKTIILRINIENNFLSWYNKRMKLDYSLDIKQTQKLMMTTKMIQEIQILQYNAQELYSYVQEQMTNNPVIEADEMFETEKSSKVDKNDFSEKEALEYIRNKNTNSSEPTYKARRADENREYTDRYKLKEETLQEHLMGQLAIASKNDKCKEIGEYIIDSLDENGYMTSRVKELSSEMNIEEEYVKKVARLIRTFEPAGVCAVDLRDCLLIQLRANHNTNDLLETIIKEHLEDIGQNRIQIIAKKLGVTSAEVEEIRETIKTLDPKPGSHFGNDEEPVYIQPDVVITKGKDGYKKEFKDDRIPSLMISNYYKSLLKEASEDKELEKYLTEKVNSGLWLIKCIEKRQETIRNVIDAIVDFQMDFFNEGEMHLKPMTLKQIAEHIGIHESTVSRTVNGKYLQYAGSIYELKYFFKSGIGNHEGEGISSTSVKASIKILINEENSKKPLSDQNIADILIGKGFEISRRTVAKYRESMEIPSSSKRRRY